ncbi:hypothetical protein LOC68_01330 [Blastopirellula sp. JC732]|uniref:DUF7133 domain-containing protein n=1 Tax=Blastopirellula sediminis TaxID=2894196 RepID=A0A9X1MHT9_9BACT|nr:hypothetical protein [Blastopirellula sediminis]MCC9608171.1 hypothetical protein [Blastopirellula sediminis]MCC9627036.1 hypothetical protein [Blastopirellula sediminis]
MRRIFLTLLTVCLGAGLATAAEQSDYYKITTFEIPEDIVLEAGGLEFMPNGELAVSTRRGDIYMVTNPYSKDPAKESELKRFASGLHEVLGLAYRDGWLYATQRCEISRLKDEDGDGKADLFETVAVPWEINGDYHEYAFGSKFDKDGYIWAPLCLTGSFSSQVPFRGWCFRISTDGKVIPTVSGIRSPGGIGINAAGDVFYTDNQGPWNGTCGLKHLEPGKFVGHPGGNRWYSLAPNMGPEPQTPQSGSRFHIEAEKIPEYVPAAVLFPYDTMGKSASGVELDRSGGKFGPFENQMLVGDQSHSTVMRVYMEKVNGRYQGVCFPFLEGIASGTLPLLMSESGSLFVGGTNRGWGSRGNKPFSLERVNWTGKTPFEIKEMRAKPDGFELEFTEPCDAKTATATDSYKLTTYTYIYQESYGSPEVDHTEPKITKIEKVNDKTVRLYIDGLQKGHVHELHSPGVRSADGQPLWHEVAYYTLNQIPAK